MSSVQSRLPAPDFLKREGFCLRVFAFVPVTLEFMVKNVLGGALQTCCTDPLTGFYRDGKCNSGVDDLGRHVVCVLVTEEFLRHQAEIGNDLITPRPEFGFPGLKEGDGWCVCVEPWKRSFEAGIMARCASKRRTKGRWKSYRSKCC
jgi:uncharacterized protein (DUF2237 family)